MVTPIGRWNVKRVLRSLAALIPILLTSGGCTSLHTLQGAKTVPPQQWEVALGSSLQQNNPISVSTKLPVPQMVLSTRYGWTPNLDTGMQLYLGGGLLDFRYHFAEVNDWHFAIAPTIGGLYLGVLGNVDFRMPVRAETALSDTWGLTLGITPMTQHNLVALDTLHQTFATNSVGGTIRLSKQGSRVRWGVTLDSSTVLGRGIPTTFSTGVDIAWLRKGGNK